MLAKLLAMQTALPSLSQTLVVAVISRVATTMVDLLSMTLKRHGLWSIAEAAVAAEHCWSHNPKGASKAMAVAWSQVLWLQHQDPAPAPIPFCRPDLAVNLRLSMLRRYRSSSRRAVAAADRIFTSFAGLHTHSYCAALCWRRSWR